MSSPVEVRQTQRVHGEGTASRALELNMAAGVITGSSSGSVSPYLSVSFPRTAADQKGYRENRRHAEEQCDRGGIGVVQDRARHSSG
jgi:hypothetical protein